jgi:hypothetical protein
VHSRLPALADDNTIDLEITMFSRNTMPDTEPAPVVPSEQLVPPVELVPLSVLALDLPAPGDGWSAFLAGRGIEVVTDDIGRASISRGDAKMLFDEQRELAQRRAEALRRADAAAEEFDRQRRAQLFAGIDASLVPAGMSAASAMLLAGHDDRPRRRSPVAEALDGQGMTYHSYESDPDGDE